MVHGNAPKNPKSQATERRYRYRVVAVEKIVPQKYAVYISPLCGKPLRAGRSFIQSNGVANGEQQWAALTLSETVFMTGVNMALLHLVWSWSRSLYWALPAQWK